LSLLYEFTYLQPHHGFQAFCPGHEKTRTQQGNEGSPDSRRTEGGVESGGQSLVPRGHKDRCTRLTPGQSSEHLIERTNGAEDGSGESYEDKGVGISIQGCKMDRDAAVDFRPDAVHHCMGAPGTADNGFGKPMEEWV